MILYNIGKALTLLVAKIFMGYEIVGAQRIPPTGPFIIASNHISLFDPPLIGSAVSRTCHFLAKKELFSNKIIAKILYSINAIPVDRGGFNRSIIKDVLNLLEKGEGIVIFPEGKRSRNLKLGEIKSGIGLLAVKSKATVIPAFIKNSQKGLKNRLTGSEVIIKFAEPIFPENIKKLPEGKEGYRELANEVRKRILSLKGDLRNK